MLSAEEPNAGSPVLVRAIGRWSLTALTINCIIGSGIFGLPSVIAGTLGKESPFAWLFAAIATGLVMACFAEVSSRFDQSGGVYLYSRTAFGRTTGIAVAWFGILARMTAIGANANLFIIYLAEFWPAANLWLSRMVVLTALFGFLTWANYVGVRSGTRLSNFFTAVKLMTLGMFVVGGVAWAAHHHILAASAPSGPTGKWLHPILLLMFAYGGYETALMPGGEAKNPRRDYPFALFVALLTCTIIYVAAQWIVISSVHPAAMSDRPIAAAAQAMLGSWGAGLVSAAILFATYGYLSANILGFPRILFALAEHGDVPSTLGRIHSRFRTPHISVVGFSAAALLFSIAGSFQWNLTISAISRLIYYGSVCAALPILRRRAANLPALFRLPAGNVIAVLALAVSLLLFPRLDRSGVVVMGVLAGCIAANSIWAIRKAKEKLPA